jgi:hypothetical protein
MTEQHGAASGSIANMNHEASFPVAGATSSFDINRNMTDSQFRQTWNQISSAATSIAAAPSAYASPAPHLPQNKGMLGSIIGLMRGLDTGANLENRNSVSSVHEKRPYLVLDIDTSTQ